MIPTNCYAIIILAQNMEKKYNEFYEIILDLSVYKVYIIIYTVSIQLIYS